MRSIKKFFATKHKRVSNFRSVVFRFDPIAAINCSSVDRRMSEASTPILEYISRANQPPRVSGRRVAQRTLVQHEDTREKLERIPKYIYVTRCYSTARKQSDILETDRPLWTPMLPQREYLETDDRLWTARYSIGQSLAKMISENFRQFWQLHLHYVKAKNLS